MKNLSDFKNEQGLELLADLMESAGGILSDKEVLRLLFSGRILAAVKVIGKNHKEEALEILAYMNGVSRDEYVGTPMRMGRELYQIFTDDDMKAFFTQPLNAAKNTSGDATDDTPATEDE